MSAVNLSAFWPSVTFPSCVKKPSGVNYPRIMNPEAAGFSHYRDGWSRTTERLTGKGYFRDERGQEWEVDFDKSSSSLTDSTPNWRRVLRGGGE